MRANLALPAVLAASFLLSATAPPAARAGGAIETIDITGRVESIPGELVARVVPIRWDPRCIPVTLRLNDTLDPVPNPLGADFLTLAETLPALSRSLDAWNRIPTSFIEMDLEGTTSNPGPRRFDLVHEITFRPDPFLGPDFFASSVSTTLIEDTVFEDGDDLDEDGDSDVASGIETCRDADGDGDIEFPEGLYRAGTILDSDVQFNSRNFRFTVADEDVDTVRESVDLTAVATHELGHTHGLAHTLSNQISRRDGTQPTMFPFLDTTDPDDELAVRTLVTEDVAASSFFYPEGTAAEGLGALGGNDVAFDQVFGVVSGEVSHGDLGVSLLGASVFAVDARSGRLAGSTVSGTARLSFIPAFGIARVLFDDPGFSILDGRYELPVPYGVYRVGIEAADGMPVFPTRVNRTATTGLLLGHASFPEELFNGSFEAAVETRPGAAEPVYVLPFATVPKRVDLTTNKVVGLRSFDVSFTDRKFREVPAGTYLAVEFPAAEIALASGGEPFALVTALFNTALADRSTVGVFAQAALVTGIVEADGTAVVDLRRPLARLRDFVVQDDDDSPFYLPARHLLGHLVQEGIEKGLISSLFLVVEGARGPLPGVSGLGPFVGLDPFAPISGHSYVSTDGVTFVRDDTADFLFELVLSKLPGEDDGD